MAKKVNIELEQGSTFQHEFEWLDEATKLPVDLTGWSAKMQIRPDHVSPPLTGCDLSTATGEIVIDVVTGIGLVTIAPAVTKNLAAQYAVYDFKFIRDSDGFVKRHSEGYMIISPEVTKDIAP